MGVNNRLPVVTDGTVFQVDPLNKLCGNSTDTKNINDVSDVGTFVNGVSIVNGVFDFDGVDDYIDFGTVNKLDLTSFTITALFKGLGGTVMDKRISFSTDSGNVNFNITTSDVFISAFYANAGIDQTFVTGLSLNGSNLNAVALTCDGVDLKLYLNGVLIDTTNPLSFTPSTTAVQDFYLGRSGRAGGDRYFNGQMSNVKIYNRALTLAEIEQNHEAQKHRLE